MLLWPKKFEAEQENYKRTYNPSAPEAEMPPRRHLGPRGPINRHSKDEPYKREEKKKGQSGSLPQHFGHPLARSSQKERRLESGTSKSGFVFCFVFCFLFASCYSARLSG